MNDVQTTIAELKEKIRTFVDEREWSQFHSPKNMSVNIATEAAELMEIMQWVEGEASWEQLNNKRQDVEDELADIAFALLNFCMRTGIDLSKAMERKIALTAQKYPVDACKGSFKKYNELKDASRAKESG